MPLTSTQKASVRGLIRRYLERCEESRAKKHYAQFRPMNHLGKSPSLEWTADCSGLATSAFYWANKYTNFPVKDPNGLRYSGYGYTGTLLSYNSKGRVPLDHYFWIGDMAIYGSSLSNTKHVTICRRSGKVDTALWTSHGSEAGPYSTYLHYRGDLLVVVRAEDLR